MPASGRSESRSATRKSVGTSRPHAKSSDECKTSSVNRVAPPAGARGNAARMRAIVGFHISVERIEAKFKLSQNRSAADQAAVIDKLVTRGSEDDIAMARFMRQTER